MFFHDLRHALRVLGRARTLTLVAGLTLALGIGANTAMFTVVNRVLLRPLPYPHGERIVQLYGHDRGGEDGPFSGPDYLDVKRAARSFGFLAAASGGVRTLTGAGDPERVRGQNVSPEYFEVFGVAPRLGRTFLAEAGAAPAGRQAVLSAGFWKRRFGADPGIVGRTLTLDGEPWTVVGVMPEGFGPLDETDVWTLQTGAVPASPFTAERNLEAERGARYLVVVGRLRPGVTVERAEAELAGIQRGLSATYPDAEAGRALSAVPLRETLVGQSRKPLLLLLGAVGLVLLIACSNVANLLLAQSTARQREVTIRAALGASAERLLRQFLTESVLLGLIGGAAGLALASLAVPLLERLVPGDATSFANAGVDASVLGFTLVVSLLAGLAFGITPALQASRLDMSGALREGGRGSSEGASRHRIRTILVASQVALSVMLLIGAGLLMRSLQRLTAVDPGFQPERVLAVGLALPQPQYGASAKQTDFYRRLLERVRALPGVDAAGAVYPIPLTGSSAGATFSIGGRPALPRGTNAAGLAWATPGYFATMGTALVEGRAFTDDDREGTPPVVVVNRALARRFFPGQAAVGQRIKLTDEPADTSAPWMTIVGVVADTRPERLDKAPEPALFIPHRQNPWPMMSLVLRAHAAPGAVLAAVRREVAALDPNLPVDRVQRLSDVVARSVAEPRFRSLLLGLFAALALVLAAVGIYGVISFTVAQRTREVGVRMALGASPRAVVALFVRRGLRPVILGLLAGTAASLALARVLRGLLFGVEATDPVTFLGVVVVLGAVALAACYIPARRATRVQPAAALNSD
ncbi:MAG TPA: ABC transporter permease [Longimicrobiales bacterium]|nr:ABC transporter permease [Longimicrobiales bacterium]